MEDIERKKILYKPAIIIVSEVNLKQSTSNIVVNMEDFTLQNVRTIDNKDIKVSRIVVFVRKDVKYGG